MNMKILVGIMLIAVLASLLVGCVEEPECKQASDCPFQCSGKGGSPQNCIDGKCVVMEIHQLCAKECGASCETNIDCDQGNSCDTETCTCKEIEIPEDCDTNEDCFTCIGPKALAIKCSEGKCVQLKTMPKCSKECGAECESDNDCAEGSCNLDTCKCEKTIEVGKSAFAKFYSPIEITATPQVSQYTLPLTTDSIYNYEDFSGKIELNSDALTLLEKNGFVVIDNGKQEYITSPYGTLKDKEVPIFITTDSLLHLYHIQFDETLRKIEEREFYDAIWDISQDLLEESQSQYDSTQGETKEAAKKNIAFFSVGLSLLSPTEDQLCQGEEWQCNPEWEGEEYAYFTEEELDEYSFETPALVQEEVDKEIDYIEAHSGWVPSPIFTYKEDYSQYVPRGHYTRSEKLKNYFKAMMWYGRISFLIKGSDNAGSDFPGSDALISKKDARLQTIAASMNADYMKKHEETQGKWDRIYDVTAFYVGTSDDLGPYEYNEAISKAFGSPFQVGDLDEQTLEQLKAELAEYRTPKIYGGTGDCVLYPPYTPEQADECLEATKGFRLMGQRFIPDSYMFQNLVGEQTQFYQGDKQPFTLVQSQLGPIRGFPRGLDVMALLGSDRARELLTELDDDNYKNYTVKYQQLENEFNSYPEEHWSKNLYWAWLHALKPLLVEYDEGYPTFMQTTAWQDKELTTALASWAELRHDTILYAKQSYTMKAGSAPPPPPPRVVGYVEPVPEFYARLLTLTKMTNQGLDDMDVLDEASKSRLQELERILEKLLEMSEKELENEELSEDDYDFIDDFSSELNGVIADVDSKAKKTTIIADVHTDGNTEQVLEEGVGYVKMMIVAYKVPNGNIFVGAGPVFSYYEFKQPMANRLTDEAWREMLQTSPPEEPEWVSNFAV